MKSPVLILALAMSLIQTASALADTPEPAKPVEVQRLMGHWFEVARMPNNAEKDCAFSTSDWTPQSGGRFLVTQTCRKAGNEKSARVIRATADPLDPVGNAKWRMNYFGGLIRRDYWVIDHSVDSGWVILGMPNKPYLWILSRQSTATPAVRDQVLQRVRALGYDPGRLIFPYSPPGEFIGPPPAQTTERAAR